MARTILIATALAFLAIAACENGTPTELERVVVTDTLVVTDTAFAIDTVFVTDTLLVTDTLFVTDTLTVTDTLLVTDTLVVADTVLVPDTVLVTDTVTVRDTVFLTTTPGLIARGRVTDSSGNPKAGEVIRIRWRNQTGALPSPFEVFVRTDAEGNYENIIDTDACELVTLLEVAVLDPTDWTVKTYSNRQRETWCNVFLNNMNFTVD